MDRLREKTKKQVLEYLNKRYPVSPEDFENIDFLRDVIVRINQGMHYGLPFSRMALKTVKDDLIIFLLRNFRSNVEVGYLVGAAYKSFTILHGKDILKQLREKFGGRLINWHIADFDYGKEDDVEVGIMYWDDEEYLYYYEMAKNGKFLSLKDDYYGLVEINVNGTKIHFVAPKIDLIANYIGKFDYIMSRWRVYGWRKPVNDVDLREVAKAIWYASLISETAKRLVLDIDILNILIDDRNLYEKVRKVLWCC